MQQALLPVDMSNFNQNNVKIIKNVTNYINLAPAKARPETFFRSEGNFQSHD